MTADDDRRATRHTVAASASLETKGQLKPNDQALCSVRNVSMTGIGVETGQPPMIGQQVFLRIALDHEIHELVTRATRVDQVGNTNFYDVGLDWSECSVEQLEFLARVTRIIAAQHADG